MSRPVVLRLQSVNLLALVAMGCVMVLTLVGDVPSEVALAAILGIAVPGHTGAPAPEP